MRRIYLASSWRNARQPAVLAALRAAGHEVYDFRNPIPGNTGFRWSDIDPDWQRWTPEQFRAALRHPIAVEGHALDAAGMDWADTCVLLLPCGRSAHLEAGQLAGQGKPTLVLMESAQEPELMYRDLAHLCLSVEELSAALDQLTDMVTYPWLLDGSLKEGAR